MGAVSCCESSESKSSRHGCAGNYTDASKGKTGISVENVSSAIPMSKMAALSCQPELDYPNGSKYQGETTDDEQRDGFGRLTFPEGSELVGDWRANKVNGIARIIHVEGDVIEGTWKDNLVTKGSGKFINSDGIPWDGFTFEDSPRAIGIDFIPNGPVYIGQMKGAIRDGVGYLVFIGGALYKVASDLAGHIQEQ